MRHVLAALAAIAVVAFIAWAGTTVFDGTVQVEDLTVTDDITVADDLTVTGTITGDVTGDVTGTITGNVTGKATGDLDATIAEVDTLKPGSGTAFYVRAADGQNDADINCADFSGNLTGNVTGDLTGNVASNTSTLFQSATYQGNLPSAASNTGEFFKNTVGDSGWVADNDSWVQLWP